jgi:hypothetical protein
VGFFGVEGVCVLAKPPARRAPAEPGTLCLLWGRPAQRSDACGAGAADSGPVFYRVDPLSVSARCISCPPPAAAHPCKTPSAAARPSDAARPAPRLAPTAACTPASLGRTRSLQRRCFGPWRWCPPEVTRWRQCRRW